MRKTLFFIGLFAVLGSWAWAQNIAVFPFEDMENVLTRNQAVMFYREFSNEFSNQSAGKFSVVPRQEVEKLINTEMAFQLNDYSAKAKTAEMQKVLNGNQILSGLIGRLDNKIRIIVSLYSYPELQQLPGGTSFNVANTTELFDRIPELVQQMQDRIARGGTTQSIPEGLLYQIVDGRTIDITSYIGNAATVNIPSRVLGLPVTSIGDTAFDRCDNLTSVTIPASVTYIGHYAFSGCHSLTSITIPSSVTFIGEGAFSGCHSLTSITIPSSVTTIGGRVFTGCDSLTSITIPSSVTIIGGGAFSQCKSLTSITVDNRNPAYVSIDGVLFDKNIRTLISYPAGRNQRAYVIPSSVTSIGDWAFGDCDSLTSITIPSSVTFIGEGAFRGCGSLTSITIPSSVTTIINLVFADCRSLTSVTIPSSVTSIGFFSFQGCSSLTSIIIPSSVTYIRQYAFAHCSSLTSVTLSRHTWFEENTFPESARITYRD